MSIHGDGLSQSTRVIRVVCIFLAAVAVVAWGIALKGWQFTSLLLGSLIVLAGALLVIQISRALLMISRQSELVRQSAQRAEEHYVGVLRRVLKFTEGRDRYLAGRADRIGQLAEQIARRLKLPAEMCKLMNLAGQLHDIGMLSIPEDLLHKRSRLGTDQYRSVQRHCEVSCEVLQPLTMLAPVLPAIRYHHERMNGTGYPEGLQGEDIPIEARVLAVADAYDAMTHDRPQRGAMTPVEAMRELHRCSPAGYDPQCVAALAEIINLVDLPAIGPRTSQASPTTAPAAG